MVTGLEHVGGGGSAPLPPRPTPASGAVGQGCSFVATPQRSTLRGRRRAEGLEPRQPEDSAVGPPPLSIPSKG